MQGFDRIKNQAKNGYLALTKKPQCDGFCHSIRFNISLCAILKTRKWLALLVRFILLIL